MLKRTVFPYLLIAPSVVILLALTAFPLFFALKNSFYFWNLQMGPQPLGFVGFDNYVMTLTDSVFLESLKNTLVLTVTGTLIEVTLGLAIALLLTRALPGMSTARAILIMPTTIAPIVVGFLFRFMYDPTGGLIPWLLRTAGLPVPKEGLLGSGYTALGSILVADAWQWTPFCAIVLYAALLAVPQDVIEAARIDGAAGLDDRDADQGAADPQDARLRRHAALDAALQHLRPGAGADARRARHVFAHAGLHALPAGPRRLQHRAGERHDLGDRRARQRAHRTLCLRRLQGSGRHRVSRTHRETRRQPSTLGDLGAYVLLALVLAVFAGPIIWFLMLAIRPSETVFAMPPVLAFEPSWEAVKTTFIDPGNNRHQLLNSLIVAAFAVALNLPFSFPAAYSLSRFRMRGRQNIMLWYLSLLMAPPVAFLIPYFVLVSRLGLSGTYLAMILIMQTITIPFSVWLMKSFIDEVPVELEEAARVDGAGWWTVILRVTLPLVRPGLIVTSMFAFVFAWNNAAFPLVLSSQKTATLPIGTLSYFATSGATWTFIGAAAVAAMLPPMIIFLMLDRYVVRGLTFGSVKG